MLLPVFNLLLMCYVTSVYCLQGHDIDFQKFVLEELTSLREENAYLKERLTKLEKISNINDKLANSNDHKRQSYNGMIAFSASVSQHVKNLTDDQTIVFGSVKSNHGQHYDKSTGKFTAPITGTYLLFANILSEQHNTIETEIVVDGASISEIYSGGYYHGAGSNLVITDLSQGSSVWVKVHGRFTSDRSVHCCWSTFSGFLMQESDGPLTVIG